MDRIAIFLTVVCAAALVAVATHLRGRRVGLSAAAVCGASMAYFMPPALSFAVAAESDQITLLLFGIASIFVVHRVPARKPAQFPAAPRRIAPRPHQQEPALASLIETAIARAGCKNIILDVGPITPAPAWSAPAWSAESESGFIATLETMLADRIPLRITVSTGATPGRTLVWVALQDQPFPDEPISLVTSRRANLCHRHTTELTSELTSFDNGFERVLQVSLAATPAC